VNVADPVIHSVVRYALRGRPLSPKPSSQGARMIVCLSDLVKPFPAPVLSTVSTVVHISVIEPTDAA